MEVSVSHEYFSEVLRQQAQAIVRNPWAARRIMDYYGGCPIACLHPKWWVSCYLERDYGIDAQVHEWVQRRRGQRTLLLGTAVRHKRLLLGSVGTLCFTKVTVQRAKELAAVSATNPQMREFVEGYFQKAFGVPVYWS